MIADIRAKQKNPTFARFVASQRHILQVGTLLYLSHVQRFGIWYPLRHIPLFHFDSF